MSALIERLSPALSQLTLGSLMGYCSGAAAKAVGKSVAVCVGVGFALVQAASYQG